MKTPALGVLFTVFLLACSESGVSPDAQSAHPLMGPSFSRAGAGPPFTGTGNYQIVDFQVLSARTAGPNTITEGVLTYETLDGPLVGTFIQSQTSVCTASGMCNFRIALGNFTGTLSGCPRIDGFTYKATVRAQLEPPPLTAVGSFTIVGAKPATGVVLAGGWTIEQFGLSGTYDARYVCK